MPTADVPSSGKGASSLGRIPTLKAGLLFLLLLGGLLHQPLLRQSLGQVLRIAAARQGLTFSARITGNMLTQCVLENVLLEARPDSHGPVERLRLRKASIHYNPAKLLLARADRQLAKLELSDAELRLARREKNDRGEHLPQESLRRWIDLLANCPLFRTQSLHLSKIDILLGAETDGVVIRGLSLSAKPGEQGLMEIESLRLGQDADPVALRALTSFENRRFTLKGLSLGNSIVLTRVQLDASDSARGNTILDVEGLCGDGPLFARIEAGQMRWRFHAEAGLLNAVSLREWIGAAADKLPNLVTMRIDLGGNPRQTKSWKGEVRIECEQTLRSGSTASLACAGKLRDGVFYLSSVEGESPESRLSGSGTITLPEPSDLSAKLQAVIDLDVESRNIGEWDQQEAGGRIAGGLTGHVALKITNGVAQAEIQARGEEVLAAAFGTKQCRIDASISAPLGAMGAMKNFAGNAVVSLTQPRYATATLQAAFEEGAFAMTLVGGNARFWNVILKDPVNTLAGEVLFPLTSGSVRPSGSLRLKAGDLSAAGLRFKGFSLGGSLEAEWTGTEESAGMLDQLSATGKGLSWGSFSLETFRAAAAVRDSRIELSHGVIGWSESEWVRASGEIDIPPREGSSLRVEANLPNLGRLSPLLAQFGLAKNKLSGSLRARWDGGGFLGAQNGAGKWSLHLKEAQWDQVRLETFECSGRHSSGVIAIAPFRLATKSTKFSAEIDWKPGALRCSKIALEQWGHPALKGDFILPLAFDQRGLLWVEDSEISGQLRADKLDLHTLLSINDSPSPLRGTVQLALQLGGTPADPTAILRCNATGVRPADASQAGNSSITLEGRYSQGSLSANATVATPLQSPVLFGVSLPLPLAALFSGEISLGDLPMQGNLHAKNLHLSPLASLLPGLRKTSGSATVELQVKGTPRNPTWLGELRVDCPLLHFASDRLPAIGGLSLAAAFSEKEIRLNRLKADLGGGNLEIHGTASLTVPGNPLLNFTAKAHEVLAVRNAKLSLRLNGELQLKGPLKHAELSGAVSPTKSRVQRDIEVLPLNVLRMEIPRETRTVGKPWFIFRKAPFSDWRFNVEVRTAQNDRIQLRGNRLRGSADAELRLEGTGATPTLHGAYRSTDLIASLPFARVELSRGRIWYTREQPFQPHVDCSAETEVRNHRIRLYLHGPASTPHITASSEPPEPEPALLTLIATGALPGDSSERSQTFANRAAAVLFQEFSDKMLTSGDHERFSALRRFSLDLGAINNRSGQQETRLTYRLMDDIFMIGELRPGGDFAARVRYLFRFH